MAFLQVKVFMKQREAGVRDCGCLWLEEADLESPVSYHHGSLPVPRAGGNLVSSRFAGTWDSEQGHTQCSLR